MFDAGSRCRDGNGTSELFVMVSMTSALENRGAVRRRGHAASPSGGRGRMSARLVVDLLSLSAHFLLDYAFGAVYPW